MTDLVEIRERATIMVKEHGQQAVAEAEKLTVEMSDNGDSEGFFYWNTVRFAIVDYLCK